MARSTSAHEATTTRWATARLLVKSTFTVCYRTDRENKYSAKKCWRGSNARSTTSGREQFAENSEASGQRSKDNGVSDRACKKPRRTMNPVSDRANSRLTDNRRC